MVLFWEMAQVSLFLKNMNMRKHAVQKFMQKLQVSDAGDAYHMTSPPENGAGAALCNGNALNDAESKRVTWGISMLRYFNSCRRLAEAQAVVNILR